MSSPFGKRFGPWAVVTGASSGIGRSIAGELARKGVNLVVVARHGDALEAFSRDLSTETGIDTRVVAVDLAAPDAARRIDAATADLDVGLLVEAAGFGTSGNLIDLPVNAELEMIDVNCRALVELSSLFGRRLAARGSGGIVLLSSLLAFQGAPGAATYAATKAFVQVFAESLRRELAPSGVTMLASAPGPVRTAFGERAGMRMSFADDPQAVARDTLRALGRKGTVRPGVVGKALTAAFAVTPRWARTLIMSRVMAQMTGHAAPDRADSVARPA